MEIASLEDIEVFLIDFKLKMSIWSVLFANREKNTNTLAQLEITPGFRVKVLEALEAKDYSQGPLEDHMIKGSEIWVFGNRVKGKEIYIKISLGNPNLSVICISFHLAEYAMKYPLK